MHTKLKQQNIMLRREDQRELQMPTLMLFFYDQNCSTLTCTTAIPPPTDVNFYCRVDHSGQNIKDNWRSQRCRGCFAYFFQKKHRLLANACTTWWGGSGKGLARALDLIFFLSFCSQVCSTCQASFLCHKGCIHWIGKSIWAKTLSLIATQKHERQLHSSLSQPCLLAS